jgi:intracellular septation protein A
VGTTPGMDMSKSNSDTGKVASSKDGGNSQSVKKSPRAGIGRLLPVFAMQLLPLIVFIVVDGFVADVRISILCAVIFAVLQLSFTYVKTRRFEWFVLIDVALIGLMGGVSIVFENDLFFKMKPAILEGVAVLLLMALVMAPDRFLERYFSRMLPAMAFNPRVLKMMKSMLVILSVSTLVHVGAVVYTALVSSREVWASVSGPGFYLTVLPVIVWQLVQKKRLARNRGKS